MWEYRFHKEYRKYWHCPCVVQSLSPVWQTSVHQASMSLFIEIPYNVHIKERIRWAIWRDFSISVHCESISLQACVGWDCRFGPQVLCPRWNWWRDWCLPGGHGRMKEWSTQYLTHHAGQVRSTHLSRAVGSQRGWDPKFQSYSLPGREHSNVKKRKTLESS